MKSAIEMPTKDLDEVDLTISFTQSAGSWKQLIEDLGDAQGNCHALNDLKCHIRAAMGKYMRLANSEIDISGYLARDVKDSEE